jgi:hypothetical protein
MSNILPLFLRKAEVQSLNRLMTMYKRKLGHTPRFQLSQKFDTATSKPTPKAKAPTKMEVT